MMQRSLSLLVALSFTAATTLAACGSDDGAPELADDDVSTDSSTSVSTPSTTSTTVVDPEGSSSGFVPLCSPGEVRCNGGSDAVEVCAATGLEWEIQLQCGTYSTCQPCNDEECEGPRCVGPCELTEDDPSSAGCAFVANRQLHIYEEFADGLVVTNPSEDLMAAVEVFAVPEGLLDEVELESFNLMPGESHTLELTTEFIPGSGTNFRTGGIFRVYSDVPVVAYQHSPLRANRGNESALLLPDRVLGKDYVVMSYNSLWTAAKGVSYFELVALEDETRIEWTPPMDTAGNGLPIEPVAAGETGTLVLNRYETIRIVPSQQQLKDPTSQAEFQSLDISGTIIHSDKPVWVTGANRYAGVPFNEGGGTADQIQETLFPLQHWGRDYVLPAAVRRPWEQTDDKELENYSEPTYYRVFAGNNNITIESTPAHPNFPLTLDATGDFVEFQTDPGEHLTLSASGPFMPVQYLRSRNVGSILGDPDTGYGDSAMVQMVPSEQYLSKYVFSTGVDFFYNFLQFTRAQSEDEIRVIAGASGNILTVCNSGCDFAFETVGDFEVASIPIEEGTFTAESDSPFGLIQSGHARGVGLDKDGEPIDAGCANPPAGGFCNSSYAYPGGMKAESIFIP